MRTVSNPPNPFESQYRELLESSRPAKLTVYEDDARARARLESSRFTPVVVDFVYRRRVAEVLLDLCLTAVAYYSSYRLRFGTAHFGAYFPQFLQSLPLVLGVQLVSLDRKSTRLNSSHT